MTAWPSTIHMMSESAHSQFKSCERATNSKQGMAADCSMHSAGAGTRATRPDQTASTPSRMDAASLDVAIQDGAMPLGIAVHAVETAILSRDLSGMQAAIGNLVRHLASASSNEPQLDKASFLLSDRIKET